MISYRADGVYVLKETHDPQIESNIVERVCTARTTVIAREIAAALNVTGGGA
jgi:hypothetical protein